MSILDALIRKEQSSTKKETPAQRRKRLIDEGQATDSDFDRPDAEKAPVLDESWANYAAAKEAEVRKKKAKTRAERAVAKTAKSDASGDR